MNILIVDDDPFQRKFIRIALARSGHTLLEAEDGEQAWELICNYPIPLVITDWNMPGITGLGLIHKIRNATLPHYTYIVLLTARDEKSDIVAGLDAGADDYVTKPCDIKELQARVKIGQRIIDLEAKLRETHQELERLATTDSLTGLYNRRAITQHLAQQIDQSIQQNQHMSLILLDIDHFKHVNDQFGHIAGDQTLQHVAHMIKSHIQPHGFVGRWGGEELAIVLPMTNHQHALETAQQLRSMIAATQLYISPDQPIQLTASFGVATMLRGAPASIELLLQWVDQALYQAKRQGRNQVVAAEPIERLVDL